MSEGPFLWFYADLRGGWESQNDRSSRWLHLCICRRRGSLPDVCVTSSLLII